MPAAALLSSLDWPRSLEPGHRMKALELHISRVEHSASVSCGSNLRLNGLLVPSDPSELASSMDSSMIEMVWIKHKLRDREKTLSHTHTHTVHNMASDAGTFKKSSWSFFRSKFFAGSYFSLESESRTSYNCLTDSSFD